MKRKIVRQKIQSKNCKTNYSRSKDHFILLAYYFKSENSIVQTLHFQLISYTPIKSKLRSLCLFPFPVHPRELFLLQIICKFLLDVVHVYLSHGKPIW